MKKMRAPFYSRLPALQVSLSIVTVVIAILSDSDRAFALDTLPYGKQLTPLAVAPNVNITGVIVDPPPCKVNGDTGRDVIFDDIAISKLDGINFSQPLPVEITCPDTFTGELNLQVSATSADFDTTVIKTDIDDFGIKITADGVLVEVNKPHAIKWQQKAEFLAIPVMKPGAKLSGKEFTATATLIVLVQ